VACLVTETERMKRQVTTEEQKRCNENLVHTAHHLRAECPYVRMDESTRFDSTRSRRENPVRPSLTRQGIHELKHSTQGYSLYEDIAHHNRGGLLRPG
jgi:hypothetical protein